MAGDIGPDRDWLLDPAGEGEGEGEGPVRAGGGSRGETWGEKGERAGVPWSPWVLPEPDAPELTAASVPVGKSSMEPDKSWNTDRWHILVILSRYESQHFLEIQNPILDKKNF